MSELTFSDVMFEPQFSPVRSRSQVDLRSYLGKTVLQVPVISANMRDITGVKMCVEMANCGCLGILHRFMSIEDNVISFQKALQEISAIGGIYAEQPQWQVGVSVGVKPAEQERFRKLYGAGARLFCIDIAHGHSILMKEMIEWIRKTASREVYLIAGNIATARAALDLESWGVDAVKVGIGPGEVCTTRKMTGVGVPQLHALEQVFHAGINVSVIADGGIKLPGDVAKALKYSDAVMIGSLFSGSSETPGDVYKNVEGQFYKTYGGSASGENKVKSGNGNEFVEGVVKTVPFKGHVKYIVREIRHGLLSSFSYSGSFHLREFQLKSVLNPISSGSRTESKL